MLKGKNQKKYLNVRLNLAFYGSKCCESKIGCTHAGDVEETLNPTPRN